MEKKIILDEIINSLQNGVLIKSSQSLTIEFKKSMLIFGEKLLELAAKNAKIDWLRSGVCRIDEKSITNTIKQVE